MISPSQPSRAVSFFRDLLKGHKAVLPTPLTTRPVIDPLSIPAYKREGIDIAVASHKTAA